jgi:hypothetical protein
MFDATLQKNDVAWSHNLMVAPTVHFALILAIVSCKQIKVQSMGANEPFGTLTLLKKKNSSTAINPSMSTRSTSSTGF